MRNSLVEPRFPTFKCAPKGRSGTVIEFAQAVRPNHASYKGEAHMAIEVGSPIPDATLMQMTDKGPQPVKTSDYFAGRKVVVFGLPGAFTPTCSNQHLPGFIEKADEVKAKGVDEIACLSVNDAFVMGAWGQQQGAGSKVTMLADGNGDFTKAMGLDFDGSGFGMGVRSVRYSMLVDDGVVKAINTEPNPGEAKVSGVDHMLGQL